MKAPESLKTDKIGYEHTPQMEIGVKKRRFTPFLKAITGFFIAYSLNLAYRPLFAIDTETPAINFGGGVNIKQPADQIADNESPDMQNFVDDEFGASFKRNGSQRYIAQAISSFPVTSLFRDYASTGTTFKKALIATVKDSVYYSTNDINPFWVKVASGFSLNQHWTFTPMQNKVIMTGDKLTDPVQIFNINTGSFTALESNDLSSTTVLVNGKYALSTRNYYILANCQDYTNGITANTTYYPSRIYYSILLQPSSFTALRFIDIRTDDGEDITGISELNSFVHIWKETSIAELDFNTLNLLAGGGDQILKQKVQGFGLYAPRTLANLGDGYIFGAKDGLRFWDGGRNTRLQVEQQSRPISVKIKPIIDKLIRAGTYRNSVGIYYPKKQWYVFAFEDPDKSPRGRNNSVWVYDIINQNWYPFTNWLIESMATMDGIGDTGQLVYGDSGDGYIYLCDLDQAPNDARKELVLDTMDSTSPWAGTETQDIVNVKEGTASLNITLSTNVFMSSMTQMAVYNLGEWPDKSKVLKSDKIAFKVFVSSISNLSSIRIDLEMASITGNFDSNFSSVTLTSSTLVGGNTAWSTIELPISTFPIRPDWVSLSSETLPYANAFTVYGIRIVSTGIGNCSLSFDDLRLVQGTENPLNAYRYTKLYNFGTSANKRARQVILNREIPSDGNFNIDIFSNFGQISKQIQFSGPFTKDLFVAGYGGTASIADLNPVDFSLKRITQSASDVAFDFRTIATDQKYLYAADKTNNILYKFDRSSSTLSVVLSTYGTFGDGTTNFNTIHEIAVDDKFLYICDNQNNRVKVHSTKDFSFINSFGTLGSNTTSFHSPTGVAVDDRFLYVANEGNFTILKLTKSTGGFVASADLNLNMVGEMTIAVDEKYLYDCYNSISSVDITKQDVILEKRFKDSLQLVQKIAVLPLNSVSVSTYAVQGNIALTDDYIYIPFTDDAVQNINSSGNDIETLANGPTGNGSFYIQKRLKSDFSIVRQYQTPNSLFGLAANGIAYIPKRKDEVEDLLQELNYLQMKYSEKDLDNNLRLYAQTFLFIPENVREVK